jgi:hypothetical protein
MKGRMPGFEHGYKMKLLKGKIEIKMGKMG